MKKIIILALTWLLAGHAYSQKTLVSTKENIRVSEDKGHYYMVYRNSMYTNMGIYDCMYFSNKVMLKNALLTMKKVYAGDQDDNIKTSINKVLRLHKNGFGIVFIIDPTKNTACEIPEESVDKILAAL